ncbi:muscarinic acetylcholine receptor M5-like [Pristis pectinata]|uniref:muscarinic acetylcholine receptor M5-like n=1 Tax=Pristis pectinata TaxID=685728 RepID=UPI00223C9FAB|nr:muscarinic acetylcholine receptor M5-like [Pristis pectinata]
MCPLPRPLTDAWTEDGSPDHLPEVGMNVSAGNSSSGSWLWPALITLPAALVSLATVVGNALVLLCFWANPRLRTASNSFLLSLAFADLLIGAVSMNLFTVYVAVGSWPLGPATCDLWLVLDYVVSNASVLNLLAICLDRYLAVSQPLRWLAQRTARRAGAMIALAWAVSLLLWGPAIVCWPYLEGRRTVRPDRCYVQFLAVPLVALGTAAAAFYLPATAMCVLYCQVYSRAAERGLLPGPEQPRARSCCCRRRQLREGLEMEESSSPALSPRGPEAKGRPLVREKKAARTLCAILLAFIVTWTPYNIMVLVSAFCRGCIPGHLWQLGYWLCYINSTVNPVCYALCNRDFRTTFRMLLVCRWDWRKWPQARKGSCP